MASRMHYDIGVGASKDDGMLSGWKGLGSAVGMEPQDSNKWKQRLGEGFVSFGDHAVDMLVQELLEENASCMERNGELEDTLERLRARQEDDLLVVNSALPADRSVELAAHHIALEQLQAEVRRVEEENQLLRRSIGERSSGLDAIDLTALPADVALEFVKLLTEMEDLQVQLNELYQEKAAAINEDNISLIAQLSEENTLLQAEVGKLSGVLAEGQAQAGSAESAVRSEMARLAEEKARAVEASCKLSERNNQLLQERDMLQEQLARAAGSVPAGSAGSDGSGTVELVHELTLENSSLVEEVKVSGVRVHNLINLNTSLMQQNQELTERLFSAAFGAGDEAEGLPITLGTACSGELDDEYRRRYREMEEQLTNIECQVKSEEEGAKKALERRLRLQARGMRTVEAHQAQLSAKAAVVPTAESEAQKREAEERKRVAEREVARRLEESRLRREEEVARKQEEAVHKMREQEKERRREEQELSAYKGEADEKVRKSYFHYAGKEDVGGFMRFLGYSFDVQVAPDPSDDELRDVFKKAVVMTHPDRHVSATLQQKALAEATYTRLQAWMKELHL